MPKHLKHKEFVPFAPEETGTVRINHTSDDCSGESNSMYIERDSHGNIYAYCHRCGKLGRHRSDFFPSEKRGGVHRDTDGVESTVKQRCDLFASAERDWSRWPVDVRGYIIQYGLGRDEVDHNAIRYNPSNDSLYLSVINNCRNVGFIQRSFTGMGAKYYTHIYDGECAYHSVSHFPDRRDVVLTEDILSAVKVGRVTNAVALLGVAAKPCVVSQLIKRYDTFTIWLDDDNRQVKKAQRVLRNTFAQVGEARIITGMGRDPKECSMDEIKGALK